jgi:hypothetical protein
MLLRIRVEVRATGMPMAKADREQGGFSQDHPEQRARLCPEGRTDAQLAGAARDGVGEQAIDSDAGEEDSQDPEEGGELCERWVLDSD